METISMSVSERRRLEVFSQAERGEMGFTDSTNLWGEMRPGSFTSTLVGSGREEVWPLLGAAVWKQTGPAHAAALFLLPTVLVWLALRPFLARGRGEMTGRMSAWLALTIVLTMDVYAITPNVVETVAGSFNMLIFGYHAVRFGFCFCSLAVVASALGLDRVHRLLVSRLGRATASVLPAAWAVGVGWQVWRRGEAVFSLDLGLLAADCFSGPWCWPTWRRSRGR